MRLPSRTDLHYAGGWQPTIDGVLAPTRSPSTNEALAEVVQAGAADVDAAVHAARAGFLTWRDTHPSERARALRLMAARIRENAHDLAMLDAADCGNPVSRMVVDAENAALNLEYFAGLIPELKGQTIPVGPGALDYTLREPLGVVARLNAYNHPFMFAAMRV